MSNPFGAYKPNAGLQRWTKSVPQNLYSGPRVSGYGTPEGTVRGPAGLQYEDLGTNPRDLYMKMRGTAETGWEKIGVAPVSDAAVSGQGYPTFSGTTAERDALTPTTAFAVWFLTDSDPPYQVSIWANSTWN